MNLSDNTIGGIKRYIAQKVEGLYSHSEIASIQQIVLKQFYGLSSADQVLQKDKRLSESEILKTVYAVQDLLLGKPIQYIVGETEFFGRKFLVNEHVLIPRPETEELCEAVLKYRNGQGGRVLDIGTGSGCIPITLKKENPNLDVAAADVSTEALLQAKANAKLNEASIEFYEFDILDNQQNPFEVASLDAIVSNPPYVLESDKSSMENRVLDFEPHLALFVSDSDALLFYRIIAERALVWLKPGGKLFFEIHESKGEEVLQLLDSLDFDDLKLKQDMFGKDRIVLAAKPA